MNVTNTIRLKGDKYAVYFANLTHFFNTFALSITNWVKN